VIWLYKPSIKSFSSQSKNGLTERELQEQGRKTLTRLSNASLKAVLDVALHLKTLQGKLKIQDRK
jgi:hypothetical protein